VTKKETIPPQAYDLAKLIELITPANRHAEIDFGPPVGKELIAASESNLKRARRRLQ